MVQQRLFGSIGSEMGAVESWAASQGYGTLIGVDEAGRGPLAGPVVTAAVVLDTQQAEREGWLLRLNDSKVLSEATRNELFDKIRRGALARAVDQAEFYEIDEHNILQATLRSMGRAVAQASRQLAELGVEFGPSRAAGCDTRLLVVVDGNKPIPGVGEQEPVVKGDARSYHIAAASILAKVTRDRILERCDRVWPDYGFAKHKGYPTKMHRSAVCRVGRSPIHRRSFKISPV